MIISNLSNLSIYRSGFVNKHVPYPLSLSDFLTDYLADE